jgi:hypothetical protein
LTAAAGRELLGFLAGPADLGQALGGDDLGGCGGGLELLGGPDRIDQLRFGERTRLRDCCLQRRRVPEWFEHTFSLKCATDSRFRRVRVPRADLDRHVLGLPTRLIGRTETPVG